MPSQKNKRKLTEKQRRFVEAFMGEAKGNLTKAARIAGYKGNNKTLCAVGLENLDKPGIHKAIERRRLSDPLVLTREEILQFWTEKVKTSKDENIQARCSENLAKAYAMFIDRQQVDSKITIDDRRQALRDQLKDATIWNELEKLDETLEA